MFWAFTVLQVAAVASFLGTGNWQAAFWCFACMMYRIEPRIDRWLATEG
jgi:hypothetical protein